MTLTKHVSAIIIYEVDWTDWLPSGETINSSDWPTTAGLTFDNLAIVSGSLKTRVRVSSGAVGRTYAVTNRIVTTGSPAQTEDFVFYLNII